MRRRSIGILAVVVVVGGAVWWLNGPGAAPPGACLAAEPMEVSAAPAGFQPTVTWVPADLPAGLTDGHEREMLAVSPLEHGWVATGRSSNGPDMHGFMLTSTNGSQWRLDPTDAVELANAEIALLVEFNRRVVASGSVWPDTVRTGVWVNRGGTSLQAARGPFETSWPTALGAGDRSLLLLGMAASGDQPLGWTSPEGSAWERIDLVLPVEPRLAAFGSVRSNGGGWLAVGSLSRGPDAAAWPVAWTSSDGATWSCLLLDRAGFEVVRPTQLHRSAQGWLAVGIASDVCGFGASCVGHEIAWTSPDGARWSAGITGTEPWHTGGIAIAGSAEGFVAVGHGTTWWSADGATWGRIADGGTGDQVLTGQAQSLAFTDDGRLAVVGTTFDGADADAWVATGVLAR